MENFQEWANGRNPFLAVWCHIAATNFGPTYGLLKVVQNDSIFSKEFPLPPLKTWLKLYRRHRPVLNSFWGKFIDPTGFWNFSSQDIWQLEWSPDFDSEKEVISKEAEQYFKEIFNQDDGEKLLENYLDALEFNPDETEKQKYGGYFLEIFQSPEFLFLARIYYPCWLLYKETPASLLRKARQGNIQSLENLLRLDSSTIFDPKISQLVHRFRYEKKSHFEKIISCLLSPPKTKISRQKVKAFWAGFILIVSFAFGERLTEPEIRGLFDAIAKDENRGEIDTDLPESPHAFYVAIRREIDF